MLAAGHWSAISPWVRGVTTIADATTTNLALVKPEQGASRDTWGGKTNNNWDDVDAIFKGDGTGTGIGLHIGTGKTLKIDGTMTIGTGGGIPGTGIADNSLPAAKIAFTAPDKIIGRTDTGAGAGAEKACTAQGFALLAAANNTTACAAIGAASLAGDNTFVSSDATAVAGPTLNLYRNSASPADADLLGRLSFTGRSLAPATVEYAAIQSRADDVTSGTTDGSLDFITRLVSAVATRFSLAAGLFARGLTDKGDGTINATGLYINGTAVSAGGATASPPGSTVGFANVMEGDPDLAIGNILPADNTIPQSGEGKEVMTLTYSPKAASNILKVEVTVCFTSTDQGGTVGTAALFLDGASSAVAAACQGTRGAGSTLPIYPMASIHFVYVMNVPPTPATPAAITFRVRLGPGGGNISGDPIGKVNFNNDYGGKSASSITVTEFQA
jgi:hypothetical protein